MAKHLVSVHDLTLYEYHALLDRRLSSSASMDAHAKDREGAEDITGSDGSSTFEQVENKLHIQKAIMVSYLEEKSRGDE